MIAKSSIVQAGQSKETILELFNIQKAIVALEDRLFETVKKILWAQLQIE